MRYAFKATLGVMCIALGLAALVTPFTPGSWLIFVGAELLGLTFLLPKPVHERWMRFKEKMKAGFLKKFGR